MSAFVELLRKSNLDYAAARKPFKIGSRSDDIFCFVLLYESEKITIKFFERVSEDKMLFILVNRLFG